MSNLSSNNVHTPTSSVWAYGNNSRMFLQQVASIITACLIFVNPALALDKDVAGMAVSNEGYIHTFYRDGTRTVGYIRDLDAVETPTPYRAAIGQKPEDIVAVAMTAKNRVYAWYRDGTRSVGTPDDLGSITSPQPFTAGGHRAPGFGFRIRYRPDQIRDIAITKDDVVLAYYEDGQMSRGTSTDLDSITPSTMTTSLTGTRSSEGLLGVGISKSNGKVIAWFADSTFSVGNGTNLEAHEAGRIYSQHLTLHATRSGLASGSTPAPIAPPDQHIFLARKTGALHEPVLAPGMQNIALAAGRLFILSKDGTILMDANPDEMFDKFLPGAVKPSLDVNAHNGLYDKGCKQLFISTDQPLAAPGSACVVEVYDTRAAYDRKGGRFIFLANARNRLWSSYFTDQRGPYEHEQNPGDFCALYNAKTINGEDTLGWSNDICDLPRRHLMIAISRSEDPKDGFEIYVVTENNYRDWPMLYVSETHLIVGHRASAGNQQANGYAAIVFNLDDMRQGKERPRYFKLDRNDLKDYSRLHFPRQQDNATMELAVAGEIGNRIEGSNVFGFTKFSTSYRKPKIVRATGIRLPADHQGVIARNQYRWVSTSESPPKGWPGPGDNVASHLVYDRSLIEADMVNGIVVGKTQGPLGSTPFAPFKQSDVLTAAGSELAYPAYCARLAVAGNNGEVIGLTRVNFNQQNKPVYEATFARRQDNPAHIWHLETLASGPLADTINVASDYLKPDPDYCVPNERRNDPRCLVCAAAQQGAAAVDPEKQSRVWIVQRYGMETVGGSPPAIRGAIGYIDLTE